MKILAFCQYYYPENFTITKICEKLVSLGNVVTVVTSKPNYGYGKILDEYKDVDEETLNGVKVIRLTVKPRQKSRISIIKNYLSYWRLSKKWVRKNKDKFDVIYSMSLSPVTILAAGNLYKKKHHVKHIVHCLDLWPESVVVTNAIKRKSFTFKILHVWSKKLYMHADKILIGSPSFEEYFRKVLLLNNELHYVPQCSIVETFLYPYKFDGGFNILYCGNIGLIQGIENVPEIMSLVQNPKVKFHIIGMGPNVVKLTENIEKYHVNDKVIFHGAIPGKISSGYFKDADLIYVSLSKEGFVGKTIPNKLEMAMCFGKPVLGVLTGDGANVIKEADCGFVVDGSIKEIAKTIDEVSKITQNKLSLLGKNGELYYKNNFAIDVIANKISELIK